MDDQAEEGEKEQMEEEYVLLGDRFKMEGKYKDRRMDKNKNENTGNNASISERMKQVSGPINIARLEGSIEGNKKVIYLLMDHHNDIQSQTECMDFRAPRLRDWLIDHFDRTDHHLDFFLEMYPMTVNYTKFGDTIKYIWDIHELFKKSFRLTKDKTTVLGSTEFPNVRLHYMDIRAEFSHILNLFDVTDIVNTLHETHISNGMQMSKHDIDHIRSTLGNFVARFQYVHQMMSGKDQNKNKKKDPNKKIPHKSLFIMRPLVDQTKEEMADKQKIIQSVISKIRLRFKHTNVRDKLVPELMRDLDLYQAKILDQHKEINKYLDYLTGTGQIGHRTRRKTGDNVFMYGFMQFELVEQALRLIKMCEALEDYSRKYFVLVTDQYALRRVLDKDYVKHGIVYTGVYHSANYIYRLVNLFGFRLTHISVSNGMENQELNKLIKKAVNVEQVAELVYPKYLTQCSNYIGFPPLFK